VVADIAKLSVGREEYYTRELATDHEQYLSGHGESPGRWYGAGATALGLQGEASPAGFRQMFEVFQRSRYRWMADNWYVGNAVADGQGDNRGWLIGHFLDGSAGPRSSDAVEVKWGIHPAGDNREAWQTGEQRTTALLLVKGRFRIELSTGSFKLDGELQARAGRGLRRLGARYQPLVVCGGGHSRDYGPVALPAAVGRWPLN
jgi:hypothetical protein